MRHATRIAHHVEDRELAQEARIVKRIVGYDLINSQCDECNAEADWRIRNLTSGLPIYAACKAHRQTVEQRFHHEYYGEPLPENHPDAIEAEIRRLELRQEGR